MKAYAAEAETTATTEAAPAKAEKKPGGLFDSPFMLVGLAALWIYLIYSMRKNKKKQKAAKEKLNEINKGDKIVTIGRIHGTVVKTAEKTFTIKPDNKSDFTLTFDREAIMRFEKRKGEKEELEDTSGVAEEIKQD